MDRVPSGVGVNRGQQQPRAAAVDDRPQGAPYIESFANARVLSQTVVISNINFIDESFDVHTELCIVPLVPDIKFFELHLGKYALLPNETEHGGIISVNNIEADYCRYEFAKNGARIRNTYNIREEMFTSYSKWKENDHQLRISVPKQLTDWSREMRCMTVQVNVTVRKPRAGVKFSYAYGKDGVLEKGAHLFTYRSSLMTSTREWLPCLDTPDQLSLWKIEITCDASLTAVASAELIEVEVSADLQRKIFHYQQSVPTSACNIGWAIGQFITHAHPDFPEFTSFALPGLLGLARHTVAPFDKVFEYFEELLSIRYPYPSYKVVFVDQIPDDVTSFSSLSILSVNVLYHKKIIDVVQDSRQILASAAAEQFFGCFVSPSQWLDWWIVKSLAKLITSLFTEKIFGMNEHLYQLGNIINDVIEYEYQWGKIILRPNQTGSSRTNLHCEPRHELTCSPLYAVNSVKKGYLVLRMLLKRIGQEPFFQVLHKILTVAQQMSERRDRPLSWTHMIISTESFFRAVTNVTGNEIPTFMEQWVFSGGHASFQLQYSFNRKRNVLELEVRQDWNEGNGRLRYVGPLVVVVQELDGSFSHTVQIDGEVSKADLQCHSKGRRQKRKKVPLYTGEEVEVDLTNMDPDSPVLWIRADPELLLVRNLLIRQPSYQWECMIKYERDIIAQLHALERIQQFPSAQSRLIILETISNDHLFYRVRCKAAHSLSNVLNKMSESWSGQPDLIEIFRKHFGSKSCALVPRANNFVAASHYLQLYFLMQALPQAVSQMRTPGGQTFPEVTRFVFELIRFNDNSINRYSDDYYRSSLLLSLSNCIVTSTSLGPLTSENIPPESRRILEEFTMALNIDTLKPSFKRVVGIAALKGICELQKNGHLPVDSEVFWRFSTFRNCVQMRKAALAIVIERISVLHDKSALDDLRKVLNLAENDEDPNIRQFIPAQLSLFPPFNTNNNSETGESNRCNTVDIADKLWELAMLSPEPRNKAVFMDVYFSLYGLGVPPVKGGPANASGHHRLYHSAAKQKAGFLSGTLDDDRPDSPIAGVKDNAMLA